MEVVARIRLAGALALAATSLLTTPAAAQDETTVTLGTIDVSTRIRTRAPGPASTTVTPSAPPSDRDCYPSGGTCVRHRYHRHLDLGHHRRRDRALAES